MNLVDMLTGSGPVVLGVLYSLIVVSIGSWAVIIYKLRQLHDARRRSNQFLERFWETRNLAEVARDCDAMPVNPLAAVFKSGYDELVRLRNRKRADGDTAITNELGGVANVERAMRRAASHQRTELERLLTFLATTASTAPFVGLFGTVWGIMKSFIGLSSGGSSSLQAVAPGISEALIATAMGLAAAIPALIFYNHFARQARVLAGDMDNFISDFLNIAERHFLN